MKSAIRCLIVCGASSLVLACSAEHAAPQKVDARGSAREQHPAISEQAKPVLQHEAEPALSAAAPQRPHSVLDPAPIVKSSAPSAGMTQVGEASDGGGSTSQPDAEQGSVA